MTAAWQFWQSAEDGEEQGPSEGADWSDYTVDQLKAELEKRGLPKSGNKDELIERLQDSD